MIDKSSIEVLNGNFAKPMLPAGAVGLRVLSLFDGMSCGQQALERIGVNVLEYYASEIDKHAIAVTMHNYPDTKQLGSVTGVDGYKLPKIDLLIGGSPCQSFSFAGKRKGMSTKCETEILTLEHYLELKNEGYEFEGQSYLFWEYMRLLNEVKPKYFLLENVMMGEKWEKILSKAIGVNAIEINSALVSAQNRRRLYWTNIGLEPGGLFGDLESTIKQPKDEGIFLKDILETDVAKKYFLSEKTLKTIGDYAKDYVITGKSPCSTTELAHGTGRDFTPRIAKEIAHCVAMRGREDTAVLTPKRTEYGKAIRKEYEAGTIETQRKNIQQLEPRTDGKTNFLTSVQKDNLLMEKSPCLHGFAHGTNGQFNNQLANGGMIRRLTPIECERLQTVKDNYTACVSETQRYRMLGNGWTVDVIAHILSYGEWL